MNSKVESWRKEKWTKKNSISEALERGWNQTESAEYSIETTFRIKSEKIF